MFNLLGLLIKALQIMLTDLVLSGDNVGVIALAVRDLPENKAGKARAMGVTAAVLLRVVFVMFVSLLFSIRWLHINLLGGVALLFITYSMIKDEGKTETGVKKPSVSLLRAVGTIVVADMSMCLDNVLAIASIAIQDGGGHFGPQEMGLVLFGLLGCIPILFFGSGLLSRLMKRFPIVIYLCAGMLVYTAVKMVFEDSLIKPLAQSVSEYLGIASAVACGFFVVLYGVVSIIRVHKRTV